MTLIKRTNETNLIQFSGTDYPDFDVQSYSESVFQDKDCEDEEDDTENEIEEFSTDSDVNSEDGACYNGRKRRTSLEPFSASSTERQKFFPRIKQFDCKSSKSSSTLLEDKELSQLSLIYDDSKTSPSTSKLKDKISWAQETLF